VAGFAAHSGGPAAAWSGWPRQVPAGRTGARRWHSETQLGWRPRLAG